MADGTQGGRNGLTRGVQLGGGVVIDRLVVSAADVLSGLESTRGIWARYPLRILDAPKGSGKTFALARVTEGRRLVCMTDRVALAQQMAERFGAELRLPGGSDPAAIEEQVQVERLAVTIHAAARLGGRSMGEDALVVDEAMHCLRTLATGRELRGWARGRVEAAFKRALRGSAEVWFAQADWGAGDVQAMVELTRQAGRGERVLHIVVEAPEVRGAAVEAPTREELRDRLLTAAKAGPVFFAASSRVACEAIEQEARRCGLDPLVVTGRTSHTERVQRWLATPRAELEPFVIVSPSVVSGLSIDAKDGAAAYPCVFLEFAAWPGGLVLDDALQFVCRVRGAPELTWWAPARRVSARDADEHYADEVIVADQSAMVLGCQPREGTELDALAAERAATGEASLWPIPRVALARGLARDGWCVAECKPELPGKEAAARWGQAKGLATEAYLNDLVKADRGPADQRTVDGRLRELGRESGAVGEPRVGEPRVGGMVAEERVAVESSEQLKPVEEAEPNRAACGGLSDEDLAGVVWLEREHRHQTPIDLLIAALAPERVRSRDIAEQGFAARADMRHDVQAGELARALLDAANVDRERLAAGASFDVRGSDLLAFVELAGRHETVLLRLLGIEAPRGPKGATRAFLTLVSRLGCERVGSRRAGVDRVRAYKVRLHPIALAALNRRGGVLVTIAPAGSTGVFPRTAEDALAARVPLRVLPDVVAALSAVQARAVEAGGADRERIERGIAALQKAVADGGLIWAQGVAREDSGRIHLRNAPLQTIPRSVRHLIVPEISEDVFVSADFRSAHLAIAAVRTGDALLAELMESRDAYERLAGRFLTGVADGRARMKVAVLAMINGAGAGKVGDLVGSAEIGRRIHAELTAELPGLARCVAEAKRMQAEAGRRGAEAGRRHAEPGGGRDGAGQERGDVGVAEVVTLTGRVRKIRKASGPGGWRRLLSAMWSGPEAEALDHVLANLPIGARLAAPMFDGLLVSCAGEDAERVERELAGVMISGARAAGFGPGVKCGIGASWAEAEGA